MGCSRKFNEDGVTSFSSGKPKVVSIEKDDVLDENDTSSNGDTYTYTDTCTDTYTCTDTDTDLSSVDNNVVQPSADTDNDILISERLKHHLE
jgi:hypothetical protein